MSNSRYFTPLDRLLIRVDEALRLSAGAAPAPGRPNPATGLPETELDDAQRREVAGLMRVNHAGEICAQALYAGQAATARQGGVRTVMQQAADEEIDHLSWCESRLKELDARTSLLNPLWYAGSFAIGAVAGLPGDRWSLGFVRETENQVEAHLQQHIERLPRGLNGDHHPGVANQSTRDDRVDAEAGTHIDDQFARPDHGIHHQQLWLIALPKHVDRLRYAAPHRRQV